MSGLRAMARVAAETSIPLAADEAVASEADAHRAVQRRSCRYATAKLSKVGGAGAARQIARVIPTYLSSALDGPVGIAAAAHAAQILREDDSDPRSRPRLGKATQRLFAKTIATRANASFAVASCTCPKAQGSEWSWTRTRWHSAWIAFGVDGPHESQHGLGLGVGRRARALRCPPSGDLPRLTLDPRCARPSARAGNRHDKRRRRALGRVLRAGGSALASGLPVAIVCTSGTAAAEPPPRHRRGERGLGAADGAHVGPPAGASRRGRRPDDRPGQALRVERPLVLRDGNPRCGRRRPPPHALVGVPRLRGGDRRPSAWNRRI